MDRLQIADGPEVFCVAGTVDESRFVYNEVFVDKAYLRHGVTILDGDCILDVGANVGMFSLFASLQASNLRILAFEPIPVIREVLERNLSSGTLPENQSIEIQPFGISHSPGSHDIAFFPMAPANSTCYLDEKRAESTVLSAHTPVSQVWKYNRLAAVGLALCIPPLRRYLIRKHLERSFRNPTIYHSEFITLDQVIKSHAIEKIDLLKIDVEGSEMDVLAGLSIENWQRVDQLVVEISPAFSQRISSLQDELSQRGFQHIAIETMGFNRFVPESGSTSSLYAVRSLRNKEKSCRI